MTRPAYLIHLPDRCTRALMLHMAVGETDIEYPLWREVNARGGLKISFRGRVLAAKNRPFMSVLNT